MISVSLSKNALEATASLPRRVVGIFQARSCPSECSGNTPDHGCWPGVFGHAPLTPAAARRPAGIPDVCIDRRLRGALLVVPESLNPAERHAFVLHDLFGGTKVAARQLATFQHMATTATARSALVNGGLASSTPSTAKLISIISFTVTGKKIVAIDILSDPDRLAQLHLNGPEPRRQPDQPAERHRHRSVSTFLEWTAAHGAWVRHVLASLSTFAPRRWFGLDPVHGDRPASRLRGIERWVSRRRCTAE